MTKLFIRIIGADISDLKEELKRNKIDVSDYFQKSSGITCGAFSDILINYVVPSLAGTYYLLTTAKIIKDWMSKKKQKFPEVKIVNFGLKNTVTITSLDNIKEVKDKLQKIEKLESDNQKKLDELKKKRFST